MEQFNRRQGSAQSCAGKRSAERAELDGKSFQFGHLLPEMEGEVVDRMTALSRALLALTSRRNLIKYDQHRRATRTLLSFSAAQGHPDLFKEIEREFSHPFAENPVHILAIAAEGDHTEFVRAFIEDRPYVSRFLKRNFNSLRGLLCIFGKHSSWSTIEPVLTFIDDANELRRVHQVDEPVFYFGKVEAALRIALCNAACYSNHALITGLRTVCGNFLPNGYQYSTRSKVIRAAFSSCNQDTVMLVSKCFDLPLSLGAHHTIDIPNDAQRLSIGYLHFMIECNCSIYASAIIRNALLHANEELFDFATGMGYQLQDLDHALGIFQGAKHVSIFRKLLGNVTAYLPGRPETQFIKCIQPGVTMEGVTLFIERGFLQPTRMGNVTSEIDPTILFHLAELCFFIPFFTILESVIRSDNVDAILRLIAHPAMPRGTALFILLAWHNAVAILPELLAHGYFTIGDAVKQIVSTAFTNVVSPFHSNLILGASGLHQLYVSLQWCFSAATFPIPLPAVDIAAPVPIRVIPPNLPYIPLSLPPKKPRAVLPPSATLPSALKPLPVGLRAEAVLVSLASLTLGECPMQAHFMELLYRFLLVSPVRAGDDSINLAVLEGASLTAKWRKQPAHLIAILEEATALRLLEGQ